MESTIYTVAGQEFELQHYGVKGMKWGRRKERDRYNESYTDKQRKQDRALYGKRSEKRINRRLNDGQSLLAARHYEVERRDNIQKTKRAIKRGAKAVTGVLGTVGSLYVADYIYNNGRGARAVKGAAEKVVRKFT